MPGLTGVARYCEASANSQLQTLALCKSQLWGQARTSQSYDHYFQGKDELQARVPTLLGELSRF